MSSQQQAKLVEQFGVLKTLHVDSPLWTKTPGEVSLEECRAFAEEYVDDERGRDQRDGRAQQEGAHDQDLAAMSERLLPQCVVHRAWICT